MPYVTASTNLPRSLDVQISLSRPQTETRTALDVMCVAMEDLGFLPNENRVRFYSSITAVEADFAVGSDAHFAASAFFAQSPRATTLGIGEVFLQNLPAQLVSGAINAAQLAALIAVADGSLTVTVNGVATDISGLNFTAAVDLEGVAAVISAALGTALVAATCDVYPIVGGGEALRIVSNTSGDSATILYAEPVSPAVGTDISALAKLTQVEGASALNGYTYESLGDELSSIFGAGQAAGKFIYGWALGSTLRDVTLQQAAATWALTRTAVVGLTVNDVNALDPAYELDAGYLIYQTDNRRAFVCYHDNIQAYPEVSIMAYMLHVNYRLQDSTVTAKFKQLPGIGTVVLTETQLSTLKAKGYNTYTAIGNSARTYRDGTTDSAGWYLDTVINLDNFVEDLSVNVFNVFLRNKKVPYTRAGQMLLVDACNDTGTQYTFNGTFADREVLDSTNKLGFVVVPAVQVIPTPISLMSAADRASRIGPPIQMVVQEAGAIHEVAINVEVVS
jgi:hypothetical protein